MIWDVAGKRIGESFQLAMAKEFIFTPDSRAIIYGRGNDVAIRDITTGAEKIRTLNGNEIEVGHLAISPNGKHLATAAGLALLGVMADRSQHAVQLWDLSSGQRVGLPHTEDRVEDMGFSPDGTMLATGGISMAVTLWDVESGLMIGMPLRHNEPVSQIQYLPDGKTLIASLRQSGFKFWDVDVESWQRRACAVANRNLTIAEWRDLIGNMPYRVTCPELVSDVDIADLEFVLQPAAFVGDPKRTRSVRR